MAIGDRTTADQDEQVLTALIAPMARWRRVEVVSETGSTNRDLAERAASGAEPGLIRVAGYQNAGRGRLSRTWTAPPETSVALSMLIQPQPVRGREPDWGWLPLATGLAVADALVAAAEVPAELKWPNDVLIRGRKVVGVLVERITTPAGPMAVLGCGINLTLTADQLPVPTATSLALEGASRTDRATVVAEVLRQVDRRLTQWTDGDPALAADYRAGCASLGRELRITVAENRVLRGRGVDIAGDGRIVVDTEAGRQLLAVGDVVHVRNA